MARGLLGIGRVDGGVPGEERFLEGPGGTNFDPDADGGSFAGLSLRFESTGLEGGGNDGNGSSGGGCKCNVGRSTPAGPSLVAGLGIALAIAWRRRSRSVG